MYVYYKPLYVNMSTLKIQTVMWWRYILIFLLSERYKGAYVVNKCTCCFNCLYYGFQILVGEVKRKSTNLKENNQSFLGQFKQYNGSTLTTFESYNVFWGGKNKTETVSIFYLSLLTF